MRQRSGVDRPHHQAGDETINPKRLVVAAAADRDLSDIFIYLAQESVELASDFVADLIHKIEWIAEVDFTGSPRDVISEGLRAFPYRKRCIFYRSYSDRIIIVRVLHSAQDTTQQQFEESGI